MAFVFCSRMLEMYSKRSRFQKFSRGDAPEYCPRNRCELFPSLPTPKFLPPTQNLIEILITHDYKSFIVHKSKMKPKRHLNYSTPCQSAKKQVSPHSSQLEDVSQRGMSATQTQKFHADDIKCDPPYDFRDKGDNTLTTR